ncbi:family 10 glycosylhydrolase [Massilia sp. H-1]|nr:family 10 glycosylhydrolase [Massilia sp. H-1]
MAPCLPVAPAWRRSRHRPAERPLPVPPAQAGTELTPPPAPREFRAAWVSTVANIDWPSKSGLNAAQQQAEAIAILDRARSMNLNAIVLQVRPGADAIYASDIEPWSEYLSGTQGKAPQPWYDPLKFWITQAHARPRTARLVQPLPRAPFGGQVAGRVQSHFQDHASAAVKPYGRFLWMDPGEEAASKQTLAVILDVVRRYDIDGVHIDDYFYPYPVEAGAGPEGALDGTGGSKPELDFPDQPSLAALSAGSGKLSRPDWRRQNVNQLIEAMYKGIHAEKSWVRFGISPFGLGLSRTAARPALLGFSQYDKLYADAETWLENGWLDYLSPQLYWPIAQAPQAYGVLLDYWVAQNRQGRHIWPGLYTSRIGAPTKSYAPDEIVQQIGLTRTRPKAERPRSLFDRGADGKPPGHQRPAQGLATMPDRRWCLGHAMAGQCGAGRAHGQRQGLGARWSASNWFPARTMRTLRSGRAMAASGALPWRPPARRNGACRTGPARWWSARSTASGSRASACRSGARESRSQPRHNLLTCERCNQSCTQTLSVA